MEKTKLKVDESQKELEQTQISERLRKIKHSIVVLSGKGGVGKSTVAANLALALARSNKKVGLLDVDVHGPSIPKILGLEDKQIQGNDEGIFPVEYTDLLEVMSVGFLLGNTSQPVIWRGPRKHGLIKQFIKDVVWGELDFLIIDSPPGTGDEPMSVAQLLGPTVDAVVVTTPQQLAISDVQRSIQFCKTLDINILGIIENMSGFICPYCNNTIDIFKAGGGEKLAKQMNVRFLGGIPIDPDIVDAEDNGKFYLEMFHGSRAAYAFEETIKRLLKLYNKY